ncbi:hypothetical protein APHAL10511_006894 [Amanita phalloides]|nr:hypothetical protein APHAL10511_006894 [Amanita phalloides]
MVAKYVDVLKAVMGTVLELDMEEVTEVRRRTPAELKHKRGQEANPGGAQAQEWMRNWLATYGIQPSPGAADDTCLVEERDERDIGSLSNEELKRITIESDAFQRHQDGVEEGITSNFSTSF